MWLSRARQKPVMELTHGKWESLFSAIILNPKSDQLFPSSFEQHNHKRNVRRQWDKHLKAQPLMEAEDELLGGLSRKQGGKKPLTSPWKQLEDELEKGH